MLGVCLLFAFDFVENGEDAQLLCIMHIIRLCIEFLHGVAINHDLDWWMVGYCMGMNCRKLRR